MHKIKMPLILKAHGQIIRPQPIQLRGPQIVRIVRIVRIDNPKGDADYSRLHRNLPINDVPQDDDKIANTWVA